MDETKDTTTLNEHNDCDSKKNNPVIVSIKVEREVDAYDKYDQKAVPIKLEPISPPRVKLEPPDGDKRTIEIEIKQEPIDYDNDDDLTNLEQPQDICVTVYNTESDNTIDYPSIDRSKKTSNIHQKSIKKESNHHCNICSHSFTTEAHLKQHLQSQHITELKIEHEERRQCPHCSRFCNSQKALDKHIGTHKDVYRKKPYKCDKCPTRFVSQSTLRTHLNKKICEKSVHRKPYTCQECGKLCATKATYESHLQRHSSVKPYTCDVCQECFKYRASIVKHVRVHMGRPRISCPSCNKMCYDRGALVLHMRTHTGEKPYKCPICDKKFSLKHTAKNHLVTHQREKNLVCSICYKKFPKESRLKYHMQTHTKEKPFSCDICKRNFSHKQNVLRHLHRKHPETTKYVKRVKKSITAQLK